MLLLIKKYIYIKLKKEGSRTDHKLYEKLVRKDQMDLD